MAKNGNASAIIKELLLNLFKYANPILNTVLGFKATGSMLYVCGFGHSAMTQHIPICS